MSWDSSLFVFAASNGTPARAYDRILARGQIGARNLLGKDAIGALCSTVQQVNDRRGAASCTNLSTSLGIALRPAPLLGPPQNSPPEILYALREGPRDACRRKPRPSAGPCHRSQGSHCWWLRRPRLRDRSRPRANAERRSLAARPGLPDRGTSRWPSSARAALAR